jgi:MGT family glycosyltransferase
MKVLFFHLPALGQYNAIEPVLLELARRGHAVIHYNQREFERYTMHGSIRFRAYARYGGYHPRSCRSDMSIYELGLLLIETAEQIMDSVEAACLHEAPDVILHSKFLSAAKVIAKRRGVPAACLTSGFVLRPDAVLEREKSDRQGPAVMSNVLAVRRFLAKARPFYTRHADGQIDPHDVFVNEETLNLVLGLARVQPGREKLSHRYQFVGPTVNISNYAKSYDLIYASLGAVFVDNREFFQTCIDALAGCDRRVVVSLGDRLSPEEFSNSSANVELVKLAPQKSLLQQAALFITHGGGNSVYEAIHCATPMLVIPQIAEQRVFARHIVSLGLGRMIEPRQLTARLLRSTVMEMVESQVFRRNMQAAKAGLPEVPAAVTACNSIEAWYAAAATA